MGHVLSGSDRNSKLRKILAEAMGVLYEALNAIEDNETDLSDFSFLETLSKLARDCRDTSS